MRLHLGPVPPPESTEKPAGVWTPIRHDFGFRATLLFATPIGGGAFVLVGWLWLHLTPAMKNLGNNPELLVVLLVAAMLAIFPVHELLHAVIHPGFGLSRKTIIGVWPARLVCYAHYDGPLSRERLLTGLATPFLVMTVLPLLISIASGHASIILACVSSLNAVGAGIDIFGIGLLWWQVPRGAKVFNQGWRTYWSRAEA